MSKPAAPSPELIAILMESEVDENRTASISSKKLTIDLLVGRKLYKATNDDPPYIKEGQSGIFVQSKNNQAELIILDGNRLISVWSDASIWEPAGKFEEIADLRRAEVAEKVTSNTPQPSNTASGTPSRDGGDRLLSIASPDGKYAANLWINESKGWALLLSLINGQVKDWVVNTEGLTADHFPDAEETVITDPDQFQELVNHFIDGHKFDVHEFFGD